MNKEIKKEIERRNVIERMSELVKAYKQEDVEWMKDMIMVLMEEQLDKLKSIENFEEYTEEEKLAYTE